MVDGTVTLTIDRGVGLRDAAWLVVQTVSVNVFMKEGEAGFKKGITGDGEGVDPTFPAESSTFVWQGNDEDSILFELRATLPLRGVKSLGTCKTQIAEAVQLSKHGPTPLMVLHDGYRGALYVRVEFTPAQAAAPKQAHERVDSAVCDGTACGLPGAPGEAAA